MKLTVEAEVDEKEVVDNLSADEIFELSNMDETNCKDRFGNELLNTFTPREVMDFLGEESFLDVIGEQSCIEHFGIEVAE